MLLRTSRHAGLATSIALGLALGTFPAAAQAPATPADSPAAVPAPGMDGRPGTLADLQEGTKVKAAYVPRDGKDIVILIEIVPAQ